jgi:hypothetical protein
MNATCADQYLESEREISFFWDTVRRFSLLNPDDNYIFFHFHNNVDTIWSNLSHPLLGKMLVDNNPLADLENQQVCTEMFLYGASLHNMTSHNHVL